MAKTTQTPFRALEIARLRIVKQPGCWAWRGSVPEYPRIWLRVAGGRPKTFYGHRLSYEIHRGPIPAGMELDHLCANSGCVNPDHLEPVTPAENQRRRLARVGGRKGFAERQASEVWWVDPAKLRNARLGRGLSQTDLARAAGVTKATVSAIETGKRQPSPQVMRRFTELLEVPLSSLVADRRAA